MQKPIPDPATRLAVLTMGDGYHPVAGTMAKIKLDGKAYYTLTGHQVADAKYVTFNGKRYPSAENLGTLPWLVQKDRDLALLPAGAMSIPHMEAFPASIGERPSAGTLIQFDEHGKITQTPATLEFAGRLSTGSAEHDIRHDATTRNGSCGGVLFANGAVVGVHYATDRKSPLPNIACTFGPVLESTPKAPKDWVLPALPAEKQSRYTFKHGVYHGSFDSKLMLPPRSSYTLVDPILIQKLPDGVQKDLADF